MTLTPRGPLGLWQERAVSEGHSGSEAAEPSAAATGGTKVPRALQSACCLGDLGSLFRYHRQKRGHHSGGRTGPNRQGETGFPGYKAAGRGSAARGGALGHVSVLPTQV